MHTLMDTTDKTVQEVFRAWLIPGDLTVLKALVDFLPMFTVSPPDQLLFPTVQDPDEEALRRSR